MLMFSNIILEQTANFKYKCSFCVVMKDFDYLIVGSGFAGSVFAERVANVLHKKVLIIEKRNHIGGNAYDFYNKDGVLVHKYGPHIFHTNFKDVWDYLSQFTEWNLYQHRVLVFVDGKKVPLPFNLNSISALFPKDFANKVSTKLIKKYGFGARVPLFKLLKEKDKDLKFLANYVYDKIFLNYTLKQWDLKPTDLDPSVTSRVPIVISKDDRYFQDKYQGIPSEGYTKMFEKMLSNKNIKILLNTDVNEVLKLDLVNKKLFLFGEEFTGKVVYTGKIDELLNYKYGTLPYRSLNFVFETFNLPFFQEVGTVNYPNNYNFTRITEFKHLTSQKLNKTTIVREYPEKYIIGKNEAYYPIIKEQNFKKYQKYLKDISKIKRIILLGRLAEYKYYNMDVVIKKAFELFDLLKSS